MAKWHVVQLQISVNKKGPREHVEFINRYTKVVKTSNKWMRSDHKE